MIGLGLMSEAEAVTYGSIEVCRRSGCTYRAFDYWCRSGAFGESAANPGGSGTRRGGFTEADVKVARGLWRLSNAGVLGGGARFGGDPRPMTRMVGPLRDAALAGRESAVLSLGSTVSVSVSLLADDLSEP